VISQPIADAVIVAAGTSRRMGGQDKLAASVAGRPLLRWAIEAFAAVPDVGGIVVVTSEQAMTALGASPWLGRLGARLVVGGRRRQDSVAAGVRATSAGIVLVHDAARPLVSSELILRVIRQVRLRGAAIPVLPVVDALKRLDGGADDGLVAGSAERGGLFRAQTPQGARRDLLLGALERHASGDEEFGDEAELLARDGVAVATVLGEASNLKVTLPEDLSLVRRLVPATVSTRSAVGIDSHPFGPADGLRLGGIVIEGAPRLHGHSDGDVVLHALCDGLLAAAGDQDLGRLFPAGDAATRGVDSRSMLADVLRRLEADGLVPDSVDLTISGARPRLGGPRLDAIAASLAALTDLPPGRVSVKASSGNLSGDEGAGRAVSATCLVSVAPR
jgi:2-C-methyl-D-erythritol 4-phosphate cytidylyltransferase/2-C-methyl-D-erythritol 2,4-cyclodiphosphate synthase